MRRADAGLTLLEVLGAVALLGIVYTVLAGSAIQALRSEGESRRRLEASLLIDERLAQLELEMAQGVVPSLGRREEPDEPYSLVLEVTPLELPEIAELFPVEPGQPSLLAPPSIGSEPSLRRIDLQLLWVEGSGERSVRRTTFAFDVAAANELLGGAAGGQTPPVGR